MSNLLSALFCLVLGSALTVSLIAWIIRGGTRQLAVTSAYRAVAKQRALSVDQRGLSIHGELDDRRVWIGEVMKGHGPNRSYQQLGILGFRRPLGFGLQCKNRPLRHRFLPEKHRIGFQTSDAWFDKRFHLNSDDQQPLGQLFAPTTLAAIRAFCARWSELSLTDHHIRVHLPQPEATSKSLNALMEGMLELAATLEKQREQLPAPGPLIAHVTSWRALADTLGLDFEPAYPALSGHYNGRPVIVQIRRETQRFRAEIKVRFHPHQEMGLRLRPQVEPDGFWNLGQDIQVDDPVFDPAFVIKGYDARNIRQLLHEQARKELLALARFGELFATDVELRLRKCPLESETVKEALLQACKAADTLGL